MKKKMWLFSTLIMCVLFMLVNSCKKDDTETTYPKIRLQSGTGLNSGAHIYFLALSKEDVFTNLTSEEVFAYRKSSAEWYIDGDVIPFITEYKEFRKSTGKYYVLLSAAGIVVRTTVTVLSGDQTFLISGSSFWCCYSERSTTIKSEIRWVKFFNLLCWQRNNFAYAHKCD